MSQPIAVIIVAAGRSVRFGGNKLLADLAGQPVIVRTISAFAGRGDVGQVVIATSDAQGLRERLSAHRLCDDRTTFSPGGDSRAASVRNALTAVDPRFNLVAIHDGARPLVSQDLISRVIDFASRHGAAAPALPVNLTIKQATGPLPAKVQRTVPRQELWSMQTPQVIRRRDLLDAYARCTMPLQNVTDDVQLIELAGSDVYVVPGDERNLKITTAIDLHVAHALLAES